MTEAAEHAHTLPAEPSPAAAGRDAERIRRLFTPGADGLERQVDARVHRMLRDFLSGPPPACDDDPASLVPRYSASTIPTVPTDVEAYFDDLGRFVEDSTCTAAPRFMGHMTSALPFFVYPLAKLVAAMNQNVVKVETSRAATLVERQVLAMMHRLIYGLGEDFYDEHVQNPASTLGTLCSGGTLANYTALWCARNRSLGPDGDFPGVEKAGVMAALRHYGREGAVVVGSAMMHYSFEKAAELLGIGTQGLIKVPVDARQRVDLDALRQTLDECRARRLHVIALVGVAGTTDAGSVDPLAELARIAAAEGVHFHVDAAWGGPVLFSRRHGARLAGIERADSVTIDAHKQLYLPVGMGLVMFRDPTLARVVEKYAHYVIRQDSSDLGRRSLEGSRPGMALLLHAALHIIGGRGYEHLIDEGIRKAAHMARAIQAAPEYELLVPPETNLVLYRYVPSRLRERVRGGALDEAQHRLMDELNVRLQGTYSSGRGAFVSRTRLPGHTGEPWPRVALRAVIANPLTSEHDIDAVLAEQARIGAELERDLAG